MPVRGLGLWRGCCSCSTKRTTLAISVCERDGAQGIGGQSEARKSRVKARDREGSIHELVARGIADPVTVVPDSAVGGVRRAIRLVVGAWDTGFGCGVIEVADFVARTHAFHLLHALVHPVHAVDLHLMYVQHSVVADQDHEDVPPNRIAGQHICICGRRERSAYCVLLEVVRGVADAHLQVVHSGNAAASSYILEDHCSDAPLELQIHAHPRLGCPCVGASGVPQCRMRHRRHVAVRDTRGPSSSVVFVREERLARSRPSRTRPRQVRGGA
eukprot:3941899-Rhodomonas_salina.2